MTITNIYRPRMGDIAMTNGSRGILPTATVSPARLRMCQPTQRPTYRTGEWIVTPWGRCRVTGRFGQRHQDLLDAFLWNAEKTRQIEDGGIEILVDPAKVRKTISDARHSLSGLQKLIRELREVTLEIETPRLMIMGGLMDHMVKSPITRPDPMNKGERHLWRVRIGLALAELLRNDLPLYYDPTPITRLQTGISQAIVRHILSHSSQPNGGWDLDNLIRSVCGELDSTMIRHRRRELRIDAAGMEAIGIFIDGERIVRRGSKPCSTRPIKAEKTQNRAAPARWRAAPARQNPQTCSTRPRLQDPSGSLQLDDKHPAEGSASPPSPSAPTPPGCSSGGEKGNRSGAGAEPCTISFPAANVDIAEHVHGDRWIGIAAIAFRGLVEFLESSDPDPFEPFSRRGIVDA
ncbi:hypothetical protein [Acidithiobacillus ferrooxidans]|uniref:hypothetical protein n=1 Tax=Acidithiobacillus ferrooxidans TaxID=920 RepID=UPI001C608E29|nr:hypothetical protein [Acidithiobacillus ferrooxidans]